MEFFVDMVTTVPDGTSPEAVAAMREREAANSRRLAEEGSLRRLWRPPLAEGEWRSWAIFWAPDAEALEAALASMPLRVWRHDTVTPLTPHPNDPGLGRRD
jgi:muconolactone delta-isomerase